jgi:hypothetical protein
MKRISAALLVLSALAVADAVLWYVLSSNLASGIYPIEADSIGIPLMEALASSLAVFVCMVLSIALPRRGRVWLVIGALPAVAAVAESMAFAASWFTPNHYLAFAAFSLVAAACVGVQLASLR